MQATIKNKTVKNLNEKAKLLFSLYPVSEMEKTLNSVFMSDLLHNDYVYTEKEKRVMLREFLSDVFTTLKK